MDNNIIITKDKHKFFEYEYKNFPMLYDTIQEFIEEMEEDIVECKYCKVISWDGCLKRCKCE